MNEPSTHRAAAAVLLTVVTLAAFWPMLANDFVIYDDRAYVTENRHVTGGLTLEGLSWAVTAVHASNWHPVTWVSHMSDWQLFGAESAGHHLMSLLIHLANTLLLFVLLDRLTGATGRSAFVAALFAIHPLHVESVAWVAERKDVLSTLFWILTTAAWVRWTRAPSLSRYMLAAALFALGLASKPMLVTLPFTLLLLDYWPLGRWKKEGPVRLVLEKTPLFAMAAVSCVVTVVAQTGAVGSIERFSVPVRISNAIVSYAAYLLKTVWPADLAVLYPHPRLVSLPALVASTLVLVAVTVWAVRARSRRPWLAVGWLWYLGTLVPVIGLVQIGNQAMADRYTYVPLIGIFVIAAWGVAGFLEGWGSRGSRRVVAPAVAVAVILALGVLTHLQTRRWRDSKTLFAHTLAVTRNNWVAHTNLGIVLREDGQPEEAVAHYRAALAIRPDRSKVHTNLGNALVDLDRVEEAYGHFARAIQIDPDYADAHYNLGLALARHGRLEEAIGHYREALRVNPTDAAAHNNLGSALARRGETAEAVSHFEEAIRLRPGDGRAHANLAGAFVLLGRKEEARAELQKARRLGFEPPAALVEAVQSR